MARGHGKVLTSIWTDRDFTTLPVEQQWLYLFLVSQPDLNFAGILPLRPLRWAGKAPNMNVAALRRALTGLEEKRYVVTDDQTGELLIRSFIRNDGVWRQPKVMIRTKAEVVQVESPRLWDALLDELSRLPLTDLSNDPTASGGPSTRKVIGQVVDDLRDHLTTCIESGGYP